MAATPPSNAPSSGDDRTQTGETAMPLTFEDKLNQFWQKNRGLVMGLCALVLVAILGKGLWEWQGAKKEREIEAEYARASTPEQLRAFVTAHPDHSLAGIAELRQADDAYAAGKSADAIASYEKAAAILKTGPLAGRVQVGRAMAKVQGGKAPEGIAELKQVVADTTQFKAARSEAGYQLASLLADAGNAVEAIKYIEQVQQIDAASTWASRAGALRATLPVPTAAPAPAAATSAPAAPASATTSSGPSVQVKLPATK